MTLYEERPEKGFGGVFDCYTGNAVFEEATVNLYYDLYNISGIDFTVSKTERFIYSLHLNFNKLFNKYVFVYIKIKGSFTH